MEAPVDDTYHLIIRTKNSEDLPDVENYIRDLDRKGYFRDLIKQGKLTVEEVQKLPFAKMCEIFFRREHQTLKSGDIRIFKNTGDYSIYFDSGE